MKNSAIILVWITTIYVFVFAALSQTDIQVQLLMGLYVLGVILVLYMAYTVLTDKYKTNKTFKDWYDDRPTKTMDEMDEK